MPKLSAEQPGTDQIIRVEITPQMLNEVNEDGTWKFNDAQLKEWLMKLRGDREIVMAKKAASGTAPTRGPKTATGLTEDDLT
jgi:hypothetical protein